MSQSQDQSNHLSEITMQTPADIQYRPIAQDQAQALKALMNDSRVRKHLMPFPPFSDASIQQWIENKGDEQPGERVRAIYQCQQLVGWCGIQKAELGFELALILSPQAWGVGRRVYRDMMRWAKVLNHGDVLVYFPVTRPEYRFIRKISYRIQQTELNGIAFNVYFIRP